MIRIGQKIDDFAFDVYQGDEIREIKFRFDCVGAYQPEKRTLECEAPRAPKPARDTDSPTTRKIGLFKRPTAWPPYEFLNRRNIFRFYDWGFVNLQENLKLDADGKTIARESGLITAVKVKPPGLAPAAGN